MQNLNDLLLFVEAARLGSLSAAARRLERTPATASASLKRLEDELNVRLVERNTRSLRLTPEGILFREKVTPALRLLEEARQVVHGDEEEIGGEIRLTAPVDFTRQWLRPLIDEFQTKHTQMQFVLLSGDTVRDLVSEPLDLALRYGELPDSALVARQLLDNRRVLVGSPEYFARHGRPKHPRDLEQHNCLLYFHRSSAYRRWEFQRGRESVVVEVSGDRTCNDGALVREWALDGMGLAYKSELDVRNDIRAGRLEPVFKGWSGNSAPLSAVYPGTGPRPARVREFVEFLRERLSSA